MSASRPTKPGASAKLDEFMAVLRASAERHPHERIGQLLINALGVHCPQVFYVEDEKLIEEVRSR